MVTFFHFAWPYNKAYTHNQALQRNVTMFLLTVSIALSFSIGTLCDNIITSKILTTTTTSQIIPTTTIAENLWQVICIKNQSRPAFIPNIYPCKISESCCFNEGTPACCGTQITNDAIIEQVITWSVLIGVLIIVGISASCYFNDHYCCDGDPDEQKCCCFRTNHFKKKIDWHSIFYPEEAARNIVDDPIFGKVGKAEDVPEFATHVQKNHNIDNDA